MFVIPIQFVLFLRIIGDYLDFSLSIPSEMIHLIQHRFGLQKTGFLLDPSIGLLTITFNQTSSLVIYIDRSCLTLNPIIANNLCNTQ